MRADLEAVLDASTPDETGFSPAERAMLRNILDLRERRVADVMVQRADIIAVKQDIPLGDLMKLFESAALSRLVVYRETLDDPEGMVHIRDLLAYITSRSQVDPEANTRRKRPLPANLDLRSIDLSMPLEHAGIVRKLLYVPQSMSAIDLLAQMQVTRVHLALVVDEYGSIDGLVSIEDLVEQIVGRIDDEHDDDTQPSIVKQPDNSFIADARAPIDHVDRPDRPAIQPRRYRQHGGYDRRLSGRDGRPVAGARRDHLRSRTVRNRGAGSGPAAAEAAAHQPAQGASRTAARSVAGRRRLTAANTEAPASDTAAQRARNVTLTRIAHSVILSWGWRRAAIAFVAGAVSVLAMAPFNVWPVLFLTLPLVVWLLDGAGAGKLGGWPEAALSGWWFGFGYFLAGLYWVGNALLVDAATFGWLLPIAVAGLPAGLAIFFALGFLIARLIWTRDASRILSLAAALTISEWLRGHVLTGFPWNTLGYAFSNTLALAQTASLIGLWGLTFLSVAISGVAGGADR